MRALTELCNAPVAAPATVAAAITYVIKRVAVPQLADGQRRPISPTGDAFRRVLLGGRLPTLIYGYTTASSVRPRTRECAEMLIV